MKIFDKDSKTNFVDDNNCFVGFDNYQCCCEEFGYLLTKSYKTCEPIGLEDAALEVFLEGYNFDKLWNKPEGEEIAEVVTCNDEGGEVAFRLTKGEEEIFLVLYNHHNGYYSHGFFFKDGDTTVEQGHL